MSFQCPTCKANTKVIDSRARTADGEPNAYRRRRCAKGHRFSTVEVVTVERGGGATVVVNSVKEHLENMRGQIEDVSSLMDDLRKLT